MLTCARRGGAHKEQFWLTPDWKKYDLFLLFSIFLLTSFDTDILKIIFRSL